MRFTRLVPLLAALFTPVAWAQQPIPQTGRLLDRNPAVGGSPFNYGAAPTPLLSGNPFATGNVRGGMALHSFSPIQDPTAFRAGLGSSSLSTFVRDSVSPADVGRTYGSFSGTPYGGYSVLPYFDPSRTAPNAEYLQGGYGAAPQIGRVPQAFNALSMNPQPNLPLPGLQISGSPSDYQQTPGRSLAPLSSPYELPTDVARAYFGVNAPGIGRPYVPNNQSPLDPRRDPAAFENRALNVATPAVPGETVEQVRQQEIAEAQRYLLPGGIDSLRAGTPVNTPMDSLLRNNTRDLLSGGATASVPLGRVLPAEPIGARPATGDGSLAMSDLRGPSARSNVAAGVATPGEDVFNDLRMAVSLERDPRAEWFQQARPDAANRARGSDQPAEAGINDAEQFISSVLRSPLRSFATASKTPVNEQLNRAEALLAANQYQEAADAYDRAALLDPINPLPIIGKGHALLAAGQYMSSAVQLMRGIQKFPDIARVPLDLTSLMGGGEIIDVRRAQIMKLLEQSEDARMRFLLGYLEYHTGARESGLANLNRAAQEAEVGSLIRRYPALLQGATSGSGPASPTAPLPLPKPIDPLRPSERGNP